MVDATKINAGDTVVIVHENKPQEVKVRAVDKLQRFKNNEVTTKIELFVEGVERKVLPEELYPSIQDYAKSLIPEKSKP